MRCVLRAPVGELLQPTLADLGELVAESGRAGMGVDLREELTRGRVLSISLPRAGYGRPKYHPL
ncbi:hypothetical protein Mth01_52600 [Sphaerimonospora thailandensis]|uniref:Uncharacterized protein n=1 Tax=Sphaerimonospora thailandensis TaxID=795644 RepID=A0A8J3W1P9_9ACTN|nr:hypothetical protein Mth01_52600 [Sphaerimonospora thailandensis]